MENGERGKNQDYHSSESIVFKDKRQNIPVDDSRSMTDPVKTVPFILKLTTPRPSAPPCNVPPSHQHMGGERERETA